MSQTRLNESISLNRSSEDQNGFTPVDTIDEGHDETPKGLEKADSVSPTSPARPVSLNSPSQSKLDGKRSLSSSFRKQGSKKVKDDVEKQTELVKTKGTIWHAVDTGDINAAMHILEKQDKILEKRGAVGENPIHLCFLFNKPAQLELAKKILEKYPQYVDAEYEGDTYKGETYLHIAIVNKNMEMVKYLVEKCKRLLTIAATGKFFSPSKNNLEGNCYYGEYPLSFAVCTNNWPMVNYLLEQKANLYQQDSHGNSVLHMCGIYGLKGLYSELLKRDVEYRKNMKENKEEAKLPDYTLDDIRNKKGLTVLTTAASEGNKDMVKFLIDSSKQTLWTYGPINCNAYPLDELDSLCTRLKQEKWDGSDKTFVDYDGNPLKPPKSVLEIAVENRNVEILSTFQLKQILNLKWINYAKDLFKRRCILAALWILALTIDQMVGFPHMDIYEEDFTGTTLFRIILDVIVIVGVVYKLRIEINELRFQGTEYFTVGGVAGLENTLCWVLIISVTLSLILANVEEDNGANIFFCSLSVLAAWAYMFSLLLGFELTGVFILMIYKILTGDVIRFTLVYLTVLIGFAAAFAAIVETRVDGSYYWTFYQQMQVLFLVMLGNADFESIQQNVYKDYTWLAQLLLVLYVVMITIALLNLLIAMMGDTYQDKKQSKVGWILAQAQNILSLENDITEGFFQGTDNARRYWVEMDSTSGKQKKDRFLQLQENNPTYYASIRSQDVGAMLDANKDGVLSTDEIRQGLASLLKKVDSVKL